MTDIRELLRVDEDVDLSRIDPRSTPGLPAAAGRKAKAKGWARRQLTELGADLNRHQEMLFAGARRAVGGPRHNHRLLLVLQAMDCGGKDGAVKRLGAAMNPLGLRIVAFGRPT